MIKIDVIGIGAQKAATSWLFKCLEEHPQVCMAEGKETHFFSQVANPQQHLNRYLKKFTHCGDEDIRGEISTSYLADPKAAERIHACFPNVTLIVSLRDPVERALSHIRHLQSKSRLPSNVTISEAIRQHPEIIDNGLYGKHLKRFLSYFREDQLHVIAFSDIAGNPRSVVRELYSSLGVDAAFTPSIIGRKYNTSAARASGIFWRINSIYLFLHRFAVGRAVIRALKKLGITTAKIESVLGGEKQDDTGDLPDRQELERHFTHDRKRLRELGLSDKV